MVISIDIIGGRDQGTVHKNAIVLAPEKAVELLSQAPRNNAVCVRNIFVTERFLLHARELIIFSKKL